MHHFKLMKSFNGSLETEPSQHLITKDLLKYYSLVSIFDRKCSCVKL